MFSCFKLLPNLQSFFLFFLLSPHATQLTLEGTYCQDKNFCHWHHAMHYIWLLLQGPTPSPPHFQSGCRTLACPDLYRGHRRNSFLKCSWRRFMTSFLWRSGKLTSKYPVAIRFFDSCTLYTLLKEWDMIHFSPHLSTNKMRLTRAPGDFTFPLVENGIQVFVDTDLYDLFYGAWKDLTYYLDWNLLWTTFPLIYIQVRNVAFFPNHALLGEQESKNGDTLEVPPPDLPAWGRHAGSPLTMCFPNHYYFCPLGPSVKHSGRGPT